jgi:hypothetical protein
VHPAVAAEVCRVGKSGNVSMIWYSSMGIDVPRTLLRSRRRRCRQVGHGGDADVAAMLERFSLGGIGRTSWR